MIKKKSIFFKFLIVILSQLFIFSVSLADKINNILVKGNDRVADETIIMFSNLQIGSTINQNILNNSLKDIYLTNYFSDVQIFNDKGNVIIKVKENPIIQNIIINGIQKDSIYDVVKDITIKIEKYPFVESKVSEQINLLKNILKSYGYYFVKLESSINYNENNTVNLIYDFNLGEIAKIKTIKFIGDKVFRDSTLRNIIVSEESKFWKFITSNKFLDANRINLDVLRLKNFYLNRGFFDIQIKSTTALLTGKNQFELIFNISSGKKYFFGEVKIDENNDLTTENLEKFKDKFKKLEGKKYSKKKVINLIDEINNFTLQNDFIFINADYKEIVRSDQIINIIVEFKETEKNYVQRINILGNYITDEKVIRNTLIVDEGDPYNKILFDKSISDLKSKNIFADIKYEVTSDIDQNKIINLSVEEKATGEIFAGAGTGTTGTSITAGIKENNYLGLGIKLDTDVTLTDDSVKGKFSVINPNYNNSDKSINTSLESSTNDFMTSSGYKTSRTGLSIGTEFEQLSDLYVNLEISTFYEDLETSSTATNIVKKQEGNYFENIVSYAITYNKLDQNFQPTDGFINNFSQKLPIYADDVSIENSLTSSIYHSLSDNLILSAKFYLKAINSIDDNVRVSKRVFVPGRLLRGFESGKIGPKDGSQFIGGNYATAMNLNSTLPNIFFENENIDLNYFIDLANVWEVDYNSSLDSNKIRSSSGLAVNWFSPIGPLTFSYAVPITESKTDITEKFRFRIGTSF